MNVIAPLMEGGTYNLLSWEVLPTQFVLETQDQLLLCPNHEPNAKTTPYHRDEYGIPHDTHLELEIQLLATEHFDHLDGITGFVKEVMMQDYNANLTKSHNITKVEGGTEQKPKNTKVITIGLPREEIRDLADEILALNQHLTMEKIMQAATFDDKGRIKYWNLPGLRINIYPEGFHTEEAQALIGMGNKRTNL